MADRPSISILGPGVVGRAIAHLACEGGYRIAAVAGGSQPSQSRTFARSVGCAGVSSLPEAAGKGQLVLLTVRDDAIRSVCEQLADAGALRHGPVVAHTSGALDCEALSSARRVGCPVGSMHPLQTFPDIDAAVAALPGAYVFLEGDDPALEVLEALAWAMGGHPVRLKCGDKSLYHAAAVMGANYLTTLLDAAWQMHEAVGLDRVLAREAMGPLVRATVENTLRMDAAEALTGPVARGDVETVRRHLKAIDGRCPALGALYRAVGRRTVALARRKGQARPESLDRLLDLLSEDH